MRLRATVVRDTGRYNAHINGTPLPTPAYLIIEPEAEGSVSLFTLDAEDHGLSDTWHRSIDDAKAQAKYAYDVDPDDWTEIE